MSNNAKHIAGFDIGGTKCAVTLAAANGGELPRIIGKTKFQTVKNAPYTVLETLLKELDGLLSGNSLKYSDLSGIGISCGGPLSSERGIILSPPNLPGWDNIEICSFFRRRTGIGCQLHNDANACAVAEWKYGAGKGLTDMAFLTFGTGLGAGLILDGRLRRGINDMAGEIGHVRLAPDGPVGYGKAGSAEGFCSGGGIRQLGIRAMREYGSESPLYKACGGDEEKLDAKLIAELACRGDTVCLGIYDKCAEMLGRAISILCDVLDLQAVIIGGIYMRSAGLLREKLTKTLDGEALNPCRVLAAGLGESVGDYAALSVAEID